MRRYAALRRRADFARLGRHGERSVGRHFVLLTSAGREASRAGITVSRGVGNAVERNRLRRRVKAILDRFGFGHPPYRDVVLIARAGAADASYPMLEAELRRLLR